MVTEKYRSVLEKLKNPEDSVLLLNFAGDLAPLGDAKTILKERYGAENLTVIDCCQRQNGLMQLAKVDFTGVHYGEIIIAAHGIPEDCEHIFMQGVSKQPGKKRQPGLQEFKNYSELAKFLCNNFLAKMLKGYNLPKPFAVNITLCICYAARAEEYEQNHVERLAIGDNEFFKTSFAYQFLEEIENFIQKNNGGFLYCLSLAAYPGAVQFAKDGEHKGYLKTQTEEQVIATIEWRKLSAQEKTKAILACFNEDEELSPTPQTEKYQRYLAALEGLISRSHEAI